MCRPHWTDDPLLCSAKRASATALVKGRNRKRAVCSVGVGMDMHAMVPCHEGRGTTEYAMPPVPPCSPDAAV